MQRSATITGLVLTLCTVLALGACKGGEKQEGAGNAQGQILPGSASDAMIPVDTVQSQAPLAPRAVSKADGAVEADATEAVTEAGATPAPAAAEKPAEQP